MRPFTGLFQPIQRNNPTRAGRYARTQIGGKIINNLRYADDTALIPENQKDLQNLLNVVKNESRKKVWT